MKFKIENRAITEMSTRAMESTLKSKAQWNLHNAICLSIEDSTLKIKSFLENMMFEGVLFPEHIESEGYAVINGKILINDSGSVELFAALIIRRTSLPAGTDTEEVGPLKVIRVFTFPIPTIYNDAPAFVLITPDSRGSF